jgi:uncharacterized protein (DUF1330 family)
MSAYVIVEAIPLDEKARKSYAGQVVAVLKRFGGEFIAFGPWHVFVGDPAYENGTIVRFPDKKSAIDWYESPAYQALIPIRTAGLDCRIRLIG